MVFKHVLDFLNEIKDMGRVDERVIEILRNPERVIEVSIPILKEDKIKIYKGYRVIYNTILGPGKGGIRFHPNITKDEVETLAFWMTIKNSLAGLPYGGAKGGIVIDPKKEDRKTIEEVSRKYIDMIYEFIGIDKDIPAPDVYTDEKVMSVMLDEYEKISRRKEPGMITGKPVILGGNPIRPISTALGGYYVLEEAIKELNIQGKKVIIHGFGNAGSNIARILYEKGFKIIGVADSKGGIYNPDGINIEKLIEVKKNTGSVVNYDNARKVSSEEILEIETDILIPASIENIITKENSDNIKAKLILELANGPITKEADEILYEKGITVIPDVLANSGGVIVSYFEWIQNRTGEIWDEEYSKKKLENKMKENFRRVLEVAREYNTNLRKAAYILAIKRIEEGFKYRNFLF